MLKSCVVTVLSSNNVLERKNWVRCVIIFLYSRTAMDTTFYYFVSIVSPLLLYLVLMRILDIHSFFLLHVFFFLSFSLSFR